MGMKYILRILLIPLLLSQIIIPLTVKAHTSTNVGGPISVDTTWTLANSPYIVILNVDVQAGITLTIEPGVIVKFNPDTKLEINGTLIARGNSISSRVSFTSNELAQPGAWSGIEFTNSATPTVVDSVGVYLSGSVLEYCSVEYAGSGNAPAVTIRSQLVNFCQIQSSAGLGILAIGTDTYPARITNTNIIGNSGGGVNSSYAIIDNNWVFYNDASEGGGVKAANSTVSNNWFYGNTAVSKGGGVYITNGVVSENVVENNSVTDTSTFGYADGGGIYANSSTIISNTIQNNFANGGSGKGGGVYQSYGMVKGNQISNNRAWASGRFTTADAVGGGLFASGDVTIENNNIFGNHVYESGLDGSALGGGVYAFNNLTGGMVLLHNNIVNNYAKATGANGDSKGGGLYIKAVSYSVPVQYNTIAKNYIYVNNFRGAGVYIDYGSIVDFQNNIVMDNTAPAGSLDGGLVILTAHNMLPVNQNTFWGNTPFDVAYLDPTVDLDGTNNYWVVTDTLAILNGIYDWYDDNTLGKFNIGPYLFESDPATPLPQPINVKTTREETTLIIDWSLPPGFTATGGFMLYYDTDSIEPPFEGVGLNEGISPIQVGDATTFALTGLDPDQGYYIAITALNTNGDESWYSSVHYSWPGTPLFLPMITK